MTIFITLLGCFYCNVMADISVCSCLSSQGGRLLKLALFSQLALYLQTC